MNTLTPVLLPEGGKGTGVRNVSCELMGLVRSALNADWSQQGSGPQAMKATIFERKYPEAQRVHGSVC